MRLQDLKAALRKIRPLLIESRKKDLNEADTRNRVERFLENVLGYDLFKDISGEERVDHRAADYAIRIGGKPKLLVEIKPIRAKLRDQHVFQLKNYAATKGVHFCILTNAVEYRLYHISFGEAVKHDLVFETNVVDDDLDDVVEKVWYLSRRSLTKNELEKYWRKKKSLGDESILHAVLSPRVLRAICREVRKESKQLISEVDVARALKRMFSEELYSMYEELADKVQRKIRRARARKQKIRAALAARAPASGQPPHVGTKPSGSTLGG